MDQFSKIMQNRQRLAAEAEYRRDPTPQSSECAECHDSGFVRLDVSGHEYVARCECRRQKIITEKLGRIPERFRSSDFQNYVPIDSAQERALAMMTSGLTGSFFIHGDYGRGKTHLATAQYVRLVQAEKPCLFLGMSELISELRQAEMDVDFFCLVRHRVRYAEDFHLFIDDIDKFKVTDFKFEVLFDLFDTIYKRKLGLTVTSNYSLRELGYRELVHPSIIRRIDDTCQAVEV